MIHGEHTSFSQTVWKAARHKRKCLTSSPCHLNLFHSLFLSPHLSSLRTDTYATCLWCDNNLACVYIYIYTDDAASPSTCIMASAAAVWRRGKLSQKGLSHQTGSLCAASCRCRDVITVWDDSHEMPDRETQASQLFCFLFLFFFLMALC